MAQFKVTPEMLRNTSGSINGINTRFKQVMETIRSDMQSMKQKWESDAANSFISKFDALKDDFEAYSQIIDSYAKFLASTAESYEKAETNINNATSNLF